jgi:hypothetical protein
MASGTWSLASDAAIWSLTNVITYDAAINAREKCQQWQQTLGPLAMMQQSGVVPDVTFLVLVRRVSRVSNGIRHLVSCQ